MRWTIWRVWVRDAVGQWNVGDVPDQSVSLLTPSRVETKELVSASFTDEDVEGAARAMAAYDGDVCFEDDTGHRDAGRKHYRDYARCVLSTYLGEGK